MCVTS